ncbi:hypothetical protein CJF32_00000635 [Rutstroemia sp. NJR-2017a WRK4]|nr:hypothetical protein CJF32_00000635 [Rutstroemia sp. NJR-2017a WRK4]
MELYSRIGIAELVRDAGRNMRATGGIYQGASLRDIVGGLKRRGVGKAKEGKEEEGKGIASWILSSLSPTTGLFVTQDQLERVLITIAQSRGVEIRFSTTCLASTLAQTSTAVTVTLQDNLTHTTTQLQTPYLVACDGASSPLRSALRIPMIGPGKLGRDFVRGREFSLCWIERMGIIVDENNNSKKEEVEVEVKGLFTSIDNSRRWVFQLLVPPSDSDSDFEKSPEEYRRMQEIYTPEYCHKLLEIALGFSADEEELKLEVISVLPWEPSVRVAARMGEGRIFLAGDAAHQMPPWAGQGANTGVGDAWSLAWRIAFVLRGAGNEGGGKSKLLDMYAQEREPVGAKAVTISRDAADERGVICTDKSVRNVVRVLGRLRYMSGHGYGCGESEGVGQGEDDRGEGWLGGWSWRAWSLGSVGVGMDGRAGMRCPHVWVKQMGEGKGEGERKSVLEVLGKRFVVLAGEDGGDWAEGVDEVARDLGVEIDVYRVGEKGDLVCGRGEWENTVGITRQGALLVRPDDVVVCRWRRGVSDSQGEIMRGMRIGLCLD